MKEYQLPIDWSQLNNNTPFNINRLFFYNGMQRFGVKTENEEATRNIINFVETTLAECCKVLGLTDIPIVGVFDSSIYSKEFNLLGEHYNEVLVQTWSGEHVTWMINLANNSLNQIYDWTLSNAASAKFWVEYFKADLARTLAHESAHQKIWTLYPEVHASSINAANTLLSEGDYSLYSSDKGEKLVHDFDRSYLKKKIEIWHERQGSKGMFEFYLTPEGLSPQAWATYISDDDAGLRYR